MKMRLILETEPQTLHHKFTIGLILKAISAMNVGTVIKSEIITEIDDLVPAKEAALYVGVGHKKLLEYLENGSILYSTSNRKFRKSYLDEWKLNNKDLIWEET